MRFYTIEERVTSILEDIKETRDSDNLLYYHYLRRYNTIALTLPIHKFLLEGKEWDIPPLESVTRIRRKVQKERPDLAPTKKIKGFRDDLEQEYKEYAVS